MDDNHTSENHMLITEHTLTNYKAKGEEQTKGYWGFQKTDHMWCNSVNKEVVCPCESNPFCQKHASEVFEKYKANRVKIVRINAKKRKTCCPNRTLVKETSSKFILLSVEVENESSS